MRMAMAGARSLANTQNGWNLIGSDSWHEPEHTELRKDRLKRPDPCVRWAPEKEAAPVQPCGANLSSIVTNYRVFINGYLLG
jgi:hypothetical protein